MPNVMRFGGSVDVKYKWTKYALQYRWNKYNIVQQAAGWRENGSGASGRLSADQMISYADNLPSGTYPTSGLPQTRPDQIGMGKYWVTSSVRAMQVQSRDTVNMGNVLQYILGGVYYDYESGGSSQGSTSYGSVTSSSQSSYPTNGAQSGYWYRYSGVEQGTKIGDVTDDSPNAYPTNGEQGGYWYVKT